MDRTLTKVTTDALGEFLGKGGTLLRPSLSLTFPPASSRPVRVRGILLHPPDKGAFQWAQVWVKTEAEVINLMGLRETLAANGMYVLVSGYWYCLTLQHYLACRQGDRRYSASDFVGHAVSAVAYPRPGVTCGPEPAFPWSSLWPQLRLCIVPSPQSLHPQPSSRPYPVSFSPFLCLTDQDRIQGPVHRLRHGRALDPSLPA
jgi:hypothetical protein